MVLKFNRDDPIQFKKKYPGVVIFVADETKNPQSFMGAWGGTVTQTLEELDALLARSEASEHEATNWGIRNGIGRIIGLDFEWSWIYRIWVDKLADRTDTLTFETPNGGKRPVFFTTEVEGAVPHKSALHSLR